MIARFLYILYSLCLVAGNCLAASINQEIAQNPVISPEVAKKIAPYLIPDDHPAKPALDAIFLTSRASHSNQTLLDAGFFILCQQPRSMIRVVKHDLLPGYLLKLVPDNDTRKKFGTPEWEWFVGRCKQAQIVASIIKRKGIKNFVVAKKWLYPLPAQPAPLVEKPHPVILVVTDMNLAPHEENLLAWKTLITPQHLRELYQIMNGTNGITYRPDNIALTKNGKFAIIDTEARKKRPNFLSIRPYLSDEMCAYWDNLCRSKY